MGPDGREFRLDFSHTHTVLNRHASVVSLASSQARALKDAILKHLSKMFKERTTALVVFLGDLAVVVERTCPASVKGRSLASDVPQWPFNESDTRPWTFPWDLPLDFVGEFLNHCDTANGPRMLQKLVETATGVARSEISDPAGKILKLLCSWSELL